MKTGCDVTTNGESIMQPTEVKPGGCAMQSGRASYRPWLIGLAAAGIPLALWGGWDWLAATGLASVLIGVAPCLVMCALGLCMVQGGKAKSQPSITEVRKTHETQSAEQPSRG